MRPRKHAFTLLTWRDAIAFVAVVILMAFAGGYRLPKNLSFGVFWSAWTLSVAACFVFFGWVRRVEPARIDDWKTFRASLFTLLFVTLVRGTLIGTTIFTAIVLANGVLATESAQRVHGRVLAKHVHSSKSGRSYIADVEDPQHHVVFDCSLSAVEYDLTRIGQERMLIVRPGFFGWPFLEN